MDYNYGTVNGVDFNAYTSQTYRLTMHNDAAAGGEFVGYGYILVSDLLNADSYMIRIKFLYKV